MRRFERSAVPAALPALVVSSWREGRVRCWVTASSPWAGEMWRGYESESRGWGWWVWPGKKREAVWRAEEEWRWRWWLKSGGGMESGAGSGDRGPTGRPVEPCSPGHPLDRRVPDPAGCTYSPYLSWGATCWPAALPRTPQTPPPALSSSCCAAGGPGGRDCKDTGTGPGWAGAQGPCSPHLLPHRRGTCRAAESHTAARRTPRPRDASLAGTSPPLDACIPADKHQK